MSNTNWEWQNLNRSKDSSVTGGVLIARNNWSLIRSRTSLDAYLSELGDTSQSLSGFNGGVTETITPPSRAKATFGTARNWIRTTDTFVESGYYINNRMVYVPYYETVNIPTSGMIRALFVSESAAGSDYGYWVVAEMTISDIINKSIVQSFDAVGWYQNWIRQTSSFYLHGNSSVTPNGIALTTAFGTFSGASTVSTSTVTGKFYCQADQQSYNQRGVDWYMQTQTWTYKDSYIIV